MGTVLVVDDEQSMREFLAICLRRAGHTVRAVSSAADALADLRHNPADVVVTDLRMPGELDGLGLLISIKARAAVAPPADGSAPPSASSSGPSGPSGLGRLASDPEVILVTAYATADTAIAAMKQGAYDYLTKPFKVDEINAVIGRAMEKRALLAENAALREQVAGRVRLAQLLGKSRAMQKVFELIGKIHSTKTSVLITGESGTGKELVARALHSEGSRAKAPFVAVNCGAIPEELMESELFGHKRGSFTGAVADKSGLFQEADGGTLFLDEIGELSLGLQVKLLRALQERRVKPVGANDEVDVDVRVVAATNRELEAEVARGAFRADLYYRLNVIELRLPPLRQRHEDIPLLVEHFIRRFSPEAGGPGGPGGPGGDAGRVTGITAEAMKRLESYDFPGNVRELENLIERAVTLASGSILDVEDLPPLRASARAVEVKEEFPADGVDLERLVADYERGWVQKALERSGGVRKKAAALLGISFRSLRYRLEKLGIDRGIDRGEDEPVDS